MGILRLSLALIVLLAHAGSPYMPMNPGLAVQAFFIISGFYMALILEKKYTSLSLFYSNRLFRLFPTYLVVLVAASVALFAFDINTYVRRDSFVEIIGSASAGPLLLANLALFGQDILCWFDITPDGAGFVYDPTFADGPPNIPSWNFLLVPQAWSISLELLFYAIAPFVTRWRLRYVVLLAVASLMLRAVGGLTGVTYDLWPRRFFPGELSLFLFGVIAFKLRYLAERTPVWSGWPALFISLLLMSFHAKLPIDTHITWAAVYLCTAVSLPFLYRTFQRVRWDARISDLSYPVYMTHILAIAVVHALHPSWPVVSAILLTLGLSFALVYFVERPVDAWRQRRVTAGDAIARTGAPQLP